MAQGNGLEGAASNKINTLVERFGGWAAAALIMLVAAMYQQDRADLQSRMTTAERGLARQQENKASKAELKEIKEAFAREQQATRQDFKESITTLKNDIIQRIDLVMPRK